MTHLFILLLFLFSIASAPSYAQLTLGSNTTVAFASVEEARAVLTNRDDFVQSMSPFDRAARMKTDRDVSEAEYLGFVGGHVLEWTEAEKQKTTSAFEGIQKELVALSLPFPRKVLIIKTTGVEEGGASYTRADAIVIPKADLAAPAASTRIRICHELFHVLTRANPELREKCYAAIGFVKCDEVEFPPNLKSRKITNPDAPRNDHGVRLRVAGQEHWAIPILFSDAAKYDAERGGEFLNYLQFRFLLVEREAGASAVKPLYDGQQARLIDMRDVRGFYEQVGRNTGYIIHPEEILADNFALLVVKDRNVRSPEIIRKLEEILRLAGTFALH